MALERCSTALKLKGEFKRKSKGKVVCGPPPTKCFEGGRYFFIKGKNISEEDDEAESKWYIFMIPAQCFFIHHQTQNYRNKMNKLKKLSVDMMFNHSLSHTFPVHFVLPHYRVYRCYTDLYDAPWVVLGSTIYFFGVANNTQSRKKDEIYNLKRNIDCTTFPSNFAFEKAGCMTCERRAPKVVALEGKIYVFGDNKDIFCEVFEPFPDCHEGQSRQFSSPIPSSSTTYEIEFVVAIEEKRKIVLGFNHKTVDEQTTTNTDVFVYDAIGDSWVKHNTDFFFNLRSPRCHLVAVGSCLYWLDTEMRAYDLNTKQSFEGPVEDCLIQGVLETAKADNLQISLIHLTGDFFGMTWVDCHDSTIIHCTTIQALKTTTNIQDNRFKLRAAIFSCESFASGFSPCLQDRALIL